MVFFESCQVQIITINQKQQVSFEKFYEKERLRLIQLFTAACSYKKLLYTAPEAEPLVVQTEGMICESNLGEQGTTGPDWAGDLINDYTNIL